MLPISAGSVAIQSTLVEYRFGTLDKAVAVAVAVAEVVRFAAIAGVTVDALADAIAEEAGVGAFVEVVEAVDFDRSLADLRRYLNYCPYPIDQTVHPNHLPIADCFDLCYYPKSLGVIVGVVG